MFPNVIVDRESHLRLAVLGATAVTAEDDIASSTRLATGVAGDSGWLYSARTRTKSRAILEATMCSSRKYRPFSASCPVLSQLDGSSQECIIGHERIRKTFRSASKANCEMISPYSSHRPAKAWSSRICGSGIASCRSLGQLVTSHSMSDKRGTAIVAGSEPPIPMKRSRMVSL